MPKRISMLHRAIALAAGTSASVTAAPTFAQTSIEEVVVTATRRETSLQDTGLSVTAFTGEQLSAQNAIRFDDIAVQTPGLQYTQAGGAPLVGLISIRGVAQNDFAHHLEAANALYVDDVYRPSTASNIQNLFDIERVEVIKGPQGTLFGRNATGGLVHVITKDPEPEFGGYAKLGFGSFNETIYEGALNVPLGEMAAARLSLQKRRHDGWIENAVGPDSIADDTVAARGKLHFTPNEALTVRLQAEYYETDDTDVGGGFPTGGFVGPDTLGRFRPSGRTDTGYLDADGDVFTGEFDFAGKYDRRETDLIADIEYRFGNFTLTSISGYADLDVSYSEDNDLTPFDVTIFRQDTEQESFSQELRLDADFDRTRVTAGFYYLDIDGEFFQNFQINNLGNFNQILAPIPVPVLPVGLNQFANYTLETESWSLFAQAEYDLTPSLTVTAGIRYTEDSKDYSYLNTCQNLLPGACPPAFDPATLAGAGLVTDSHTEDGISARFQVDYAVTDDVLLYASYNRGYKAFNYNAGFAGAAAVASARFDGEFLDAYEGGAKIDFWNKRARLNVAGFYYDYSDYQAFDQRGVDFILFNTDARIYGADAEFQVNPGYGLSLSAGLSLLDTKVEDITIAGQAFEREAPQSPDVTFNFAAAKEFVTSHGTFRLGLDGTYTGEYYSQLTNAPVTLVESNWLLNTRLSFTTPNERWEASVFARNVLDDARQIYAFDITFPGNGLVEQTFAPPRWIGGSVQLNF